MERRPADLPRALRNVVGHREDLRRVIIEEQMVVAEMFPAHMPVEILGLDVEREYVGQQLSKLARDFGGRVTTEIRYHLMSSFPHLFGRSGCVCHVEFLLWYATRSRARWRTHDRTLIFDWLLLRPV